MKRVIAPKALDRFKQRIREITGRAKGVSMETTMEELAPYMHGWRSYFGFCEAPEVLVSLTGWCGADYDVPYGGNRKPFAVAGRHCWSWVCVHNWRPIWPAVAGAPGIWR